MGRFPTCLGYNVNDVSSYIRWDFWFAEGGLGGRGWMYIDYIDGKASGPVGAFPRLDSPKN
jgi:hypothetical protein